MRRQTTTSRVAPAGSSRDERLDPFGFPLLVDLADRAGDDRMRLVELRRERAVLRPAARGIKPAPNLPVAAYLGVAIRMEPPAGPAPGAVALVLEHPDPALSLTLYRAADGTDIVAEWRAWGRALGLPLLVAEADGRLREPFNRIGGVGVGPPISRRRRRSALRRRRPALRLRRWAGTPSAKPLVHRGVREIIARD
ncbi:MAG: DUF6101 family protein [Xanthobacteraceae bacterium]